MNGERVAAAEAWKDRTKQFAVRIVKMFQALPKTPEARISPHPRLATARLE
jgi:hypothetical protein